MSSYDQTISDTTLYALQPLGVMSKPQKNIFLEPDSKWLVCGPLSKMIWSLSLDRLFHHASFLFTSLQGLVNLLLCVNNAESSSSHTSVLVNVTFVSPVLTIGLSLVRHILQFDPQALQTHDFWHIKILTLNIVPLSDQV